MFIRATAIEFSFLTIYKIYKIITKIQHFTKKKKLSIGSIYVGSFARKLHNLLISVNLSVPSNSQLRVKGT